MLDIFDEESSFGLEVYWLEQTSWWTDLFEVFCFKIHMQDWKDSL